MSDLTVLGAGVAGLLSAGHFHKWTPWDIEIIHDPDTPAAAVGEGCTPNVVASLYCSFGFSFEDFDAIDARMKWGIEKDGWGQRQFTHWFYPDIHALHFDAALLREWILSRLEQSARVTITERAVGDVEDIDSAHVMDCRGKPPSFDGYEELSIPVNAAVVANFPPEDRDTTLARVMPNGWLFAIPLQSRTAYGYIHNSEFVTEDQAVAEMEAELDMPVERHRYLPFDNYWKPDSYGRVTLNGNRSFFVEPLEATSLTCAEFVARHAYDFWCDEMSLERVEYCHRKMILGITQFINLHYFYGSRYNTPFWDYAVEAAQEVMRSLSPVEVERFRLQIDRTDITGADIAGEEGIGIFGSESLFQQVRGLGITKEHLVSWDSKAYVNG